MSFVKLDAAVLDSSLWLEAAEVRIVFITILAMTHSDGLCEATAPGIARRANLPLETVRRALEILEAPDPDSRSTAEDGRRIKRVDGGFLVINYLKYRAKDHTAAERKRRQRNRERQDTSLRVSRRDTVTVTQAEAEADTEKRTATTACAVVASRSRRGYSSNFEAWFLLYRKATGRGTTKADASEWYSKLTPEDREQLPDRTRTLLAVRERARAAGAFVAPAPDPVRFIRHRRWEDEIDLPAAAAEAPPSPNDLLVRDQLDHGADPRWQAYEREVLDRRRAPGTWDAFSREQEARP